MPAAKLVEQPLHGGVTVHADDVGEGASLYGVVRDGEGVFAYVRLATAPDIVPPRIQLPGLDGSRRYRVRVRPEAAPVPRVGKSQAPWLEKGVELPGSALTRIGLPAPLLHPGQAVVLQATPL